MIPDITLAIYRPLPERQRLAEFALAIERDQLSFSSSLPVGFNALAIGFDPEREPIESAIVPRRSSEWQEFAHIELTTGARTLWAGQIIEAQFVDGQLVQLNAEGYAASGLDDIPFASTDDDTLVTTAEVIQLVLAQCAAYLTIGTDLRFQDPGVEWTLAQFDGMYPSEIVDQLLKAGGYGGYRWDFGFWEGERAFLLPRIAPDVAHYRARRARWTEDYRKVITEAYTLYEEHDTAQQTDPIYDYTTRERIGRRRVARLQGGRLTQAAAQLFTASYLQAHNRAEIAADVTATTMQGRFLMASGLEYPGGAPVPRWLVRAGEWVEIVGLGSYVIIEAQYDAVDDSLSLKLGALGSNDVDLYRHVLKIVESQERKINPVSGGKERTV